MHVHIQEIQRRIISECTNDQISYSAKKLQCLEMGMNVVGCGFENGCGERERKEKVQVSGEWE